MLCGFWACACAAVIARLRLVCLGDLGFPEFFVLVWGWYNIALWARCGWLGFVGFGVCG